MNDEKNDERNEVSYKHSGSIVSDQLSLLLHVILCFKTELSSAVIFFSFLKVSPNPQMSMAKVSTYRAPDAITDQRTAHLEREGQDSLDNFIIQAIGKEPYLSFSRPGDSSIQWIQLLHALEQQGSVKKGARIDNIVEENDSQQHSYSPNSSTSERHVIKESGSAQKCTGAPARVTKNSSEHMQSLKIPEAVIAFAQAAAKANGEREKCMSSMKSRYFRL